VIAGRPSNAARHRATAPPREPAYGCTSGKQDHPRRLRKIEGQVRGLQKMIETETCYPDVVTQVAPATGAMQEVAVRLSGDHLRQGVMQAMRSSPADGDQALLQATGAIHQVVRP
jgi:DNA-binding FrmR family transcriptional regulator